MEETKDLRSYFKDRDKTEGNLTSELEKELPALSKDLVTQSGREHVYSLHFVVSKSGTEFTVRRLADEEAVMSDQEMFSLMKSLVNGAHALNELTINESNPIGLLPEVLLECTNDEIDECLGEE